jgi:sulfur-oxidizing protein SoxY
VKWNYRTVTKLCTVIPRASGEPGTPQHMLGLLGRPLARAMTPQRFRQNEICLAGEAMLRPLNRREALAAGAGALAAGVGLTADSARALNDYADQIKEFTGGRTPVESGMRLELPELAENGNTVPLSVAVDTPVGAHVQEIVVFAPANPNARVIRFLFSLASVPGASTRIRLAETQDVIAVAKLSDGTFLSASRQIKVTIGGCGG